MGRRIQDRGGDDDDGETESAPLVVVSLPLVP